MIARSRSKLSVFLEKQLNATDKHIRHQLYPPKNKKPGLIGALTPAGFKILITTMNIPNTGLSFKSLNLFSYFRLFDRPALSRTQQFHNEDDYERYFSFCPTYERLWNSKSDLVELESSLDTLQSRILVVRQREGIAE